MNQEQAKSIARWLLTTFGSILISVGAKYGIDSDTVGSLLNSEMVIGLVATGISLAWSLVAKTPIGLILSAAKVIAVKEIAVDDPQLARDVGGRTPEARIVVK